MIEEMCEKEHFSSFYVFLTHFMFFLKPELSSLRHRDSSVDEICQLCLSGKKVIYICERHTNLSQSEFSRFVEA